MSEDSKKRQELLKQIANRGQQANISLVERVKEFLFAPSKWDIVERTTSLPGDTDVEAQKFILNFDYLKLDICVFGFDSTKARALIRLFQRITVCQVNALISSGIVRDNISNTPPYESLFGGLSPEVEMKETELPDGGRVFFFITGNKFKIVSIETQHRDPHHNVGY